MLIFDEKLKLLRISSFLGKASLDFLSETAAAAIEQSFKKGEFIYAKNDAATDFYVLIEGRVHHPEVQLGEAIATQVTTSGQMFGFGAAVPSRRITSSRCESPTKVLAINGEWFRIACKRYGYEGLLQELSSAHASYERSVLGRSGWISIRNAGKVFGPAREQIVALDDCSFEVRPGEFRSIVGPKGCGKSTLLNLIAGFEPLTAGVIYLDGEVINRPGSKPTRGPTHIIGSQESVLATRATIRDNLIGSLKKRRDQDSLLGKADELLERLGLVRFKNSRLQDVPPAVAKRAEIIRAFLNDPYVLLDEPTRDLDARAKAAMHEFLLELYELSPKTIVFITEDIDEAIYLADRVLVMTPAGGRKQTVIVDLPRPRAADLVETPDFLRLKQEIFDTLRPPASETGRPQVSEVLPWKGLEAEVPEIKIEPARQLPTATNAIKEAIHEGKFFWTIEFIPSVDKVLRDELNRLGGIAEIMRQEPALAGFSVTDRVVSDRDPEPVAAASHLLDASCKQPLVHFSGKGRDIIDLYAVLQRMDENGLENILFLTGDRLREESNDHRPRYLESVPAIQAARAAKPDLQIAAALNPFKYREEDAMAQYLKLGKKIAAGAHFIITQIGFDMFKYEEALFWVDTRNYRIPLVANVMPMPASRARYIRRHQLAGVTVTDSFLSLLEAEERLMSDKGASRVLRRLALQILGVRFYGYSGVQLTGIHSAEKLAALHAEVSNLADLCNDRITWNKAWDEALTLPEAGRANPAPANDPWYLVNQRTRHASRREKVKYHVMDAVHSLFFDQGLVARLVKPIFLPVERHGKVDYFLERLERAIKAPLFGCETCGMCRLAATQYVCPETCPKGLANGACGGTTENLCEFRDRECIHSAKYRIANDVGVPEQLEKWLIPSVPRNIRNTSSWPPHFRGEGPKIHVVDFFHPEEKKIKGW
jgi:ABC-type nitrate/sulfonate/bicarbonate transport system ATPase subunit/5,10-methylenetetrahydrofolate reductase